MAVLLLLEPPCPMPRPLATDGSGATGGWAAAGRCALQAMARNMGPTFCTSAAFESLAQSVLGAETRILEPWTLHHFAQGAPRGLLSWTTLGPWPRAKGNTTLKAN
jgi:hypothetical protein